MMEYLIIAILGIIIGICSFPFLMFLRARRDSGWDDSNMTNMLRVLAHLATHPGDFGKAQYPDGKQMFPYINKDEFSEVVKTRPEQ